MGQDLWAKFEPPPARPMRLQKRRLWICLNGDGTGSIFTSTLVEPMRAVEPGSLPTSLLYVVGRLRGMSSDLHTGDVSPLCLVKAACQGQGRWSGLVGQLSNS